MEIEEIERGGERERERKRREEEEWERVEEWERIDTPQVWKPFEEGDSLTGKVKTIETNEEDRKSQLADGLIVHLPEHLGKPALGRYPSSPYSPWAGLMRSSSPGRDRRR